MPLDSLESENLLYTTQCPTHDAAAYWPLLSNQEKTLTQRKVNQTLRDQAILSYGLRRKIIASVLACEASQLCFDQTANQKPILVNQQLHFNVSHSEDYWVILINQKNAVGVDVESIQRKINCLELANRFFSKEEVTLLKNEKSESKLFWQLWTAKEALLKATGQGLLNGLEQSYLYMNAQGRWQAYAKEFDLWQLETLTIYPDVMLSAAIPKGQKLAHYCF